MCCENIKTVSHDAKIEVHYDLDTRTLEIQQAAECKDDINI